MTEIDWSKAPEGATHCTPAALHDINFRPVFWRVVDGVVREVWPMSNDYSKVKDHFRYGEGGCASFDLSHAVKRPAPAWTGEGLPPVGEACEYYWAADDSWRAGTCVAHFYGRVVICDVDDEDCAERLDAHHVRAIRTPEQIAAEELKVAAQKIMDDAGITDSAFKDDPEAWVWAVALHKAGYRKVEGGTP